MLDRTSRLFSGLGVLVIVWIIVYWAWPVKEHDAAFSDLTLGDSVQESNPEIIGDDDLTQSETERRERIPLPRFEPATSELSGEVPATPASAAGRVIPPEFSDYTIRSGDNFERISQRVYGVRRHAMAIARSNPLLDPRKLRAGQVIRVPTNPANIQGIVADPDPGSNGDVPATSVAQNTPIIEYTVKRGDTLSGIAKAFYGSIRHVDFLYESNRDRMASKDDLRLGQVLQIPPLPAGAD